jgi:hypothetical protein
MSTMAAIFGQKFAPGALDRYLGSTGYRSQQTDQPVAPDRPDNLYEPVDGLGRGDAGTFGTFGSRAAGMLDPSFLRSVPRTALDLGGAFADRARDVASPLPVPRRRAFHQPSPRGRRPV